jgi:predicted HicB family RNase H-like nuclease
MAGTNDRYAYRVIWSEEDQAHIGLCAEFPSLSWVADSVDDAFKGIRDLVATVVKDMEQNGEPVPEPILSKAYSGKFMVRIPPEVHRQLAVESAESGISLNRLVSAKLSK